MNSPESKINPDIAKVEVGIRELKELTLYPLSAAFQLKLAKNLGDLLVDFFSVKVKDLSEDEVSQKIASLFIQLFQDNVKAVLEQAFDPRETSANGYDSTEALLEDISTKQFISLGDIIYKNNYEDLVGKISGYLRKKSGGEVQEKIQKIASVTKDASLLSADTTELTNLKTSSTPAMKED